MDDIELLYFEKELSDIKKAAQKIKYKGDWFYLYDMRIYDAGMNVIIDRAENGFLDLFEYYEYFEQNTKRA